MRCLVTGAAGFIGSHLSEHLVRRGHAVRGVDCFVPYYPRAAKENNLQWVSEQPDFTFRELDLRSDPLADVLDGVEVIFHLAAMPGLAASWTDFDLYMSCNLLATQRLVEAARQSTSLRILVHASTSSVYGRTAVGDEDSALDPISPYGVTKLAAEKLVLAYHRVYGVPCVVLRYFSVYGPRQRPDMGTHIFIEKLLQAEPIVIYGDGEQTRGSTFVDDCVAGTLLAAEHAEPGDVFNIGGGEVRSVNWVVRTLGELTGREPTIRYAPARPGDQLHTQADVGRARRALGYEPATPLREGLARQVAWQQTRRRG